MCVVDRASSLGRRKEKGRVRKGETQTQEREREREREGEKERERESQSEREREGERARAAQRSEAVLGKVTFLYDMHVLLFNLYRFPLTGLY